MKIAHSRRRGAAAGLAALTAASAVFALTAGPAAARAPHVADWALSKENTVHQTYPLTAAPGGGRAVDIDSYCGEVRVTGSAGTRGVSVTVHQVFRADTREKLDLAQRAVTLKATDQDGRLRLYVDGPFRSPSGGIDFDGWRKVGYEACFDLTVEMPADADLTARNVQGGDVRLTGIGGHFEASNVNGGLVLEQMAGSGRAHTVNGALRAGFARVPAAGGSFETVNGRVDVTLPPALAADLTFETVNGRVYSDFPYTWQNPPPAEAAADTGGAGGRHRHYRTRGAMSVKVAGGGPQLSFTTVNGDILIHKGNA